jgi:hypothetical protein
MLGINKSMKTFHPTYLYIKTHNITGLKYFGKTTKDPITYRGSGKYWRAHLKKHGNDVTTEVLGYYTDKERCSKIALEFSISNNIIKAVNENNTKVWANQINENGTDGGATTYGPRSEETKQKISEIQKGKIVGESTKLKIKEARANQKNVRKQGEWSPSLESRKKISASLTGRKRNPESVQKTADKLRGRKRPDVSKKLKGRTHTEESREKMKIAQQNKPPMSEQTKLKIKEARKNQIFTDETKKKLSGKVIVIDKSGEIKKIPKDEYYSQIGCKSNWEYVAHNSLIGKARKSNAVPVFSDEEAKDISKMRR